MTYESLKKGSFEALLKEKIDNKTKPFGALGRLEQLAFQIASVQQTLNPVLKSPKLFVFAADHGIVKEGVSAYPSEVTYQMVLNFLKGGAAINVFCKQNNIDLQIVDAGVDADFSVIHGVINRKIAKGTQNFLYSQAMTAEQCHTAISYGGDLIDSESETSIFCFGEMGIGNTSSASMLMSLFCDLPIEYCVGRGTGLSDEQFAHKLSVLIRSLGNHNVDKSDTIQVLSTFGGFEIAMMAGAMMAAAENGKLIMVDGFIATAAFLVAFKIVPEILSKAIFSHVSDEQGHSKMLDFLGAEPLLKLDLRLGEGTGCALAYPLVQAAVNFLNDMASFESAGVSK